MNQNSNSSSSEITPDIYIILKNPRRGDIVTIGDYSYRYTAMGGRWQQQLRDVIWNSLDYLQSPFLESSEIFSLIHPSEEAISNEDIQEKIREIQDIVNGSKKGNIIKFGNSEYRYTARGTRWQVRDARKDGYPWATEDYLSGPFVTTEELLNTLSGKSPEQVQEDEKKSIDDILSPEPQNQPDNDTDKGDVTPQSQPVKPDTSKIKSSRSLQANISEVKQNLQDIARSRAEERLRREQKEIGLFKKMGRFFTRAKLLDKYVEEELSNLKSENIFDASTQYIRENASDRFGKSNTLFANNAILKTDTIENEQINSIANQYIRGELSREGFQEEFTKLLAMDGVSEKLKDIDQQGTNILKYLDGERSLRVFFRDLGSNKENIDARLTLFTHDVQSRKLLEASTGLTIQDNREELLILLSDTDSLKILMDQMITVQLDVLTGGEAAFAIDNQTKTNTRAYAIGKWLQKHPILSAFGTGLGITASSIAGGPIGNLIFGSSAIGGINGLRRNAEFTDEHAGFEKRITNGTHLKSDIYNTVEQLKSELSRASGIKKRWIQFKLKRAESKLALYQSQGVQTKRDEKGNILASGREGTTHRHFLSISGLNRRLTAYLHQKEGFELVGDKAEKNKEYYRQWILQGLARLDTWKQTGHNFLKSGDADSMEADYNILYENILFSIEKLDTTIEDLRKDDDYKKIIDSLLSDYNRASESFASTRTTTSVKRGVMHGAIYGTSSIVFQWLAGTGLFDTVKTVTGAPVTVPGGVAVDPGIAKQLELAIGPSQYQKFVEHLAASTTPETLWDTLVKDIFQNKAVGNDVKNQIMTFILNATDVQNGITKPELLIEAAQKGFFTDIANNSPRIDSVMGLLKQWGYGNVNKTWLLDTIKGIDAGTVNIAALTPMEQTKVAEALWCYVHRDGISEGSHMWQVFMDRLPDTVVPGKDTVVAEKGGNWLKYFAIPTWSTTFLSRIKNRTELSTGADNTSPFGGVYNPDGTSVDIPASDNFPDWFKPDSWKEDYTKPDYYKGKDDKKSEAPTPSDVTQKKVITRGDKISIDSRDTNPDYPMQYPELDQGGVLEYMTDKSPLYFGDDFKYYKLYKEQKISREDFIGKLSESNKRLKDEISKNLPIYNETLKHAHEALVGIFQKYGLNLERIMPLDQFMSKVHFHTFYEFMAHSNPEDSTKALSIKGFNYVPSGDIVFNTFGLMSQPIDKQIKFIKHVAIHELLHGTAVNNYWEFGEEKDSNLAIRRTGLLMYNPVNRRERGRAMNEAVVETLAFDTMLSIFGESYVQEGDVFYRDERRVLSLLVQKFGIPMDVFVRGAYDRQALSQTARLMQGSEKQRPQFLTLMMSLMDNSIGDTENFLNDGIYLISPNEYKKVFHPSLLNNGKLSDELLKYIEVSSAGIRMRSISKDIGTISKDETQLPSLAEKPADTNTHTEPLDTALSEKKNIGPYDEVVRKLSEIGAAFTLKGSVNLYKTTGPNGKGDGIATDIIIDNKKRGVRSFSLSKLKELYEDGQIILND